MRNRKQVVILLIICMLLLAVGTAGGFPEKDGTGAGNGAETDPGGGVGEMQILSRSDFETKKQQFREDDFIASDLAWKGVAPACDEASSSVYIPCDVQEMTSGAGKSGEDPVFLKETLKELRPVRSESSIYVCSDWEAGGLSRAVKQGRRFDAFLVSGDSAEMFYIILTGLPVLCVEKTDSEEIVYKEEHRGRFRYIPLSASDDAAEYLCRFHVRGNVSAGFSKKPYKISLVDSAGEKKKASFCGLRRDDDWILNPLFTDETRVREMTAYALWDKISAFSDVPQASARMRYVELFFDNSYEGIYGLMEPVDGKQLGLDKGDLLYKISRWHREYPYINLYEEKAGKTEIYNDYGYPCVEIRYPKEWDETASWLPMQAFHHFSFRTRDSGTLRAAGLETDLDSVVSMSLYCALTHAMDNTWKNSFLIAKQNTAGGYTLFRTIWDLNYVFGDVFVYEKENGYTAFEPDTASSYTRCEDSTYDFEAFLQEDPSLEEKIRAKWAVWRSGGISADSVCAEAEANMNLLEESGAMKREKDRWPPMKETDRALEKMEDWIRERFVFLDTHFGLTQE